MTHLTPLCRQLLMGLPGDPLTLKALKEARQWLESLVLKIGHSPPSPPLNRPSGPKSARLAPLFLLDGLWLAGLFSPATGHLASHCRLHPIFIDSLSLGSTKRSTGDTFRAYLDQQGEPVHGLEYPSLFIQDLNTQGSAMALTILVFQHSPIRYFPEILGFTLAHLKRPPAEFEEESHLERRRHHQVLAEQALKEAAFNHQEERRVSIGEGLYRFSFNALSGPPHSADEGAIESARNAMIRIIQGKMPEALGYHGRVFLEGQSIDDWFRKGPAAAETLVRALETTDQDQRRCPMAHRLLHAMDFGGPMYGVFNERERDLTASWIENPETPVSKDPGRSRLRPLEPRPKAASSPPKKERPLGARALYGALLQTESPLEAPDAAAFWLRQILTRTDRWTRIGLLPKPKPYHPDALDQWLRGQHRKAVERHQAPPKPITVDKTFCRWALLQLAPAILVDGAWLWGLQKPLEGLKLWDRDLIRIHFDELGEGQPEWNHPNVYRDLLRSEGIELGDFRTEVFQKDRRLLNAAFDFPCTLLSMGALQSIFPAECLGLNLAIETSGLGTHYLRAIEILRHHEINPAIVSLHLSIDNLSSGHSARALSAIQSYLETLQALEGPEAMQAAWRRIWRGFNSFKVANLALASRLMGRLFLHQHGYPMKSLSR